MQLKSIEITGFKSFAKTHTLFFNTPVTAIVGPNGSGKSNVVEAIRFVLGEQSNKSLRSKTGADLIFKGSKELGQLSRAAVTVVFDNTDKKFQFTSSDDKRVSLDYDEIRIGREVFRDGGTTYTINGVEVRLKDVNELLASVHIGASGHHIISQGEADRILSANTKDRRGMVEDALGLRMYQYRIRESERKLEKTRANMKEVASLRRELAPHVQFLKKQVEKIQKAEEARIELGGLYRTYIQNEQHYINTEKQDIDTENSTHQNNLAQVEHAIAEIENKQNTVAQADNAEQNAIHGYESEIKQFRIKRDELTRAHGRLEGMLDILERPAPEVKHIKNVSFDAVKAELDSIDTMLQSVLHNEDIAHIRETITRIRENIHYFLAKDSGAPATDTTENENKIVETKNELKLLSDQIHSIYAQIATLTTTVEELKKQLAEASSKTTYNQADYVALIQRRSDLVADMRIKALRQESHSARKERLTAEMQEATALIGYEALRNLNDTFEVIQPEVLVDLKRKIDRLKIRLEDMGAGGGADVVKEYEDIQDRETFLARELTDLENSIQNITLLIVDLRETLNREFKNGIENINKAFQEFFALMFGGGHAFLSVVAEHKRRDEEDEGEVLSDIDQHAFHLEHGVDINVSLPHKKVKDLHMLSGGERSLTSIALLFAMSQVNPPPFLVLDETDAALDEANSKRYGDMLERLSKFSQLIVVTHNRETMSRAEVLYGVTVGGDGGSRLLSVKFSDAEQYAK